MTTNLIPTIAEQYTVLDFKNRKRLNKILTGYKILQYSGYLRTQITVLKFKDNSELTHCKGKYYIT